NEHDEDEASVTEVFEVLLNLAAYGENDGVKDGEDDEGRESVCVTAAEDDVDIHEPVAQDGVGNGEWDQRERDHRVVHIRAERDVQDERDRVEQRERREAEEDAVAQPFELLADDGVFGSPVAVLEDDGARNVAEAEECHPDAVEEIAHIEE